MFLNSLSGRFLLLTVAFVMLAEVMIFVPSIARFREDYLLARLDRAQIASLALLATNDTIDRDLEAELLKNAEVFNVVLRRDEMRELVLSSPIPAPINASYDLRMASPWTLILDALICLFEPDQRIIRVIGAPLRDAGLLIEITMDTGEMRAAMIEYGQRILVLSAAVSVVAALMLFLAVRGLRVAPIRHLVDAMKSYAAAPEDTRRIIAPQARVSELREAEEALQSMQTDLTGALRQKERLAQLGGAVAKISHDLRNILTTAQLFADRMETSQDPAVQRAAPKLVGSIARAISLSESTLAFGKAEEPAPRLERIQLFSLIEDVIESERLAAGEADISFAEDVPVGMTLRADPEQLYRVISNLVRNARQAILTARQPGEICVSAVESDEDWTISVADTGPGLPPKAQEYLFQPFHGGVSKGGSGLGLAIASDLVRGHGGRLKLLRTGPDGTVFTIVLPKNVTADTPPED